MIGTIGEIGEQPRQAAVDEPVRPIFRCHTAAQVDQVDFDLTPSAVGKQADWMFGTGDGPHGPFPYVFVEPCEGEVELLCRFEDLSSDLVRRPLGVSLDRRSPPGSAARVLVHDLGSRGGVEPPLHRPGVLCQVDEYVTDCPGRKVRRTSDIVVAQAAHDLPESDVSKVTATDIFVRDGHGSMAVGRR